RLPLPVYVLQKNDGDISAEEFATLAGVGAKGLVSLNGEKPLGDAVNENCSIAYQQGNLNALGRANKVLSHKTLQRVSEDGTHVEIALFDFKLTTALDAGDNNSVLDGISKPNVKFTDVIGANDAKEELSYFIEYLKNPSKFVKRGVRAPKGILLYGPPGTGKTLLAKAMAGESDVTFIRAEGNQFLKKYVGEGAESVHKLFNTARKYAPSILFIDEIDAIAKQRGENNSHSDDVLTSFLTEMDGFNSDTDRPVFVLAATNYETSSLDAALLRRFDRKIYVDLPNKEERVQFIRQKLAKIAEKNVSVEEIENLAVRSTGISLADLDSVFELALRNVLKTKDYLLSDSVLEDAFEMFNSGSVKKWSENELMRTARHEAGHALMCYLGGQTPSYLTIVARGSHGGYMQYSDGEDKGTYTKKELLSRVRTALGGRAAEVVYYGEEDGVSTGASGDLRTATNIIENMICNYGMDETVGLSSVELKNVTSSHHYALIVERINEVLAREFTTVKASISKHRAAIDALVEMLIEKNALKSNEIENILKKKIKK
ncbi:MAG: ATP-dependent metallopeptidase FtsH/Yme1/Tma family protein, partial [Clostridia bacterium]|nr:ATP-dependent metallopeptidase FtsH/Yme1/Tma family protein [Clostridia bacterium]